MPLIIYLKDEGNFGGDREAGLDTVARLVDEGVCVGVKYAVVCEDPAHDPYLERLLARVSPDRVISGIGERPAITHMRDWKLPGFTTGSGCLAPGLSAQLFRACVAGDYERAEVLRSKFIPLEDRRDAWGPARVLHHATAAAGLAETGPIPPYVSELSAAQLEQLAPVAGALVEEDGVNE
jgi:dihydrodipicolinate synthase/N-acetylneuraminate lyase